MIRYTNTQFRYVMIYVLITFAVLLFLNIYSYNTSQKILWNSKKAAMLEKSQLAINEIVSLEVVNNETLTETFSQLDNLRVNRLIVTDPSGKSIFDSYRKKTPFSSPVLFPEIAQAIQGYDVMSCHFTQKYIQSCAASPIYLYDRLIGCIYMMEYDVEQGQLIASLHYSIFSVTLILEIVVLVFSLAFARGFSKRIRRIMNSMKIIQDGDFSHKVEMGGHDELTFLGNEFNDLTDRLQESERKRTQFVSDASHELRTPLAAIKLLSDSILQNDMDIQTIREFVQDIGSEADRLNRMSQNLLTLSRTDAQPEISCEIIPVAPTVHRVLRMLSVIAKKNNIVLKDHITDDPNILINEDDLYQIIFNLAENGIKYNHPDGSLTISLQQEEDNAVIRVSDTGAGIPEAALKHIFDRFYRVDKARARQSGGCGLGLAIVKGMVNRNHGTIDVKSVVGTGSTFTVSFPIFDTEEDI